MSKKRRTFPGITVKVPTFERTITQPMYSGLNSFVDALEKAGELCRVTARVDPELEIAEITDRMSKQPDGGKALLFTNTGTGFPVLTNAMGSEKRISMALGRPDLQQAGKEIEALFHTMTAPKPALSDKLRMLPLLGRMSQWLPATQSRRGACQEVIHHDPDLSILPILRCWPADGGRFITLPLVHTRHPQSGSRNCGMYRMQVTGCNTTGMHWHRHKTGASHYAAWKAAGQRMPIAVALGGDPVYTYCATAPLPENADEYLLAGFLRHKRVTLVRCLTQDIYVPADADIIIEGYVDPSESHAPEGPFGDHTGFYSLTDLYPVFHVTCITHRQDAVYPATIVGIPPQEDTCFALATERLFLTPLRLSLLPELEDMHLPPSGTAHNLALAQIRKEYPGQGIKTIHSLWGSGQMMFNKILIVTDFPIRDYLQAVRLILNRVDFHRDIHQGQGPLDVLDHASSRFAYGSKLGIDATLSMPEETLNPQPEPAASKPLPTAKELESTLLGFDCYRGGNFSLLSQDIPLTALSIQMEHQADKQALSDFLSGDPLWSAVKVIILTEGPSVPESWAEIVWLTSSNIDPERDVRVHRDRQQIIVDATDKLPLRDGFERLWPCKVLSHADTIKTVDARWKTYNLGALLPSPSLPFGPPSGPADAFVNETVARKELTS